MKKICLGLALISVALFMTGCSETTSNNQDRKKTKEFAINEVATVNNTKITINSVKKILKECSFYILPSYNEGMPMSVLEGMAYKNIVISTNVGGIPKVIENNKNGILIEPGDKEKLEEELIRLLKNKDLRLKLSKGARKTVELKFNIENIIKKIIKTYM